MSKAKIHYHDIGDYLSREEKLSIVKEIGSIANPQIQWQLLEPNEHGDWLNQRSNIFESFISLAPDKKYNKATKSIFVINSNGMQTNRDSWVYNFSKHDLIKNMTKHVSFYNQQVKLYKQAKSINENLDTDNFKNNDPKSISWSSSLIVHLERFNEAIFEESNVFETVYRPFTKEFLYLGDKMIHRRGQFESFFSKNIECDNKIICVGIGNDFSILICNTIADSNFSGYLQAYPLYWYSEKTEKDLFSEGSENDYIRQDGVSDYILKICREQYGNRCGITKEDIFYYVYGFLHSPDYRTAFEADLKKMLPRLPLVDNIDDFWAFSKAGRDLADLHLNYETVESYKDAIVTYGSGNEVNYKVEKMRFGKNGKQEDKTTIIYNHQITISNIPLEAYDYIVNGKSAIDWIMERYQITTHKESGIQNNPNNWATEHDNEKYILNLLLSIITVSIETMKIVNSLPKIKFE